MSISSSFFRNILKNIIVLVVIAGSLSVGVFPISATGIDGVVTDPGVNVTSGLGAGAQTTSTATDVMDKVAKSVLAPVLQSIMNQLMDKMNNSIINWVNTGFDGNPFYIEDPKQFALNIALDGATNVAGRYRTELNSAAACDDRQRALLEQNPDADVPPCDTTLRSTNTNRAILLALGDTSFKSTADALEVTDKTKDTFDNIAKKSNARRSNRPERTSRKERRCAEHAEEQALEADMAATAAIEHAEETGTEEAEAAAAQQVQRAEQIYQEAFDECIGSNDDGSGSDRSTQPEVEETDIVIKGILGNLDVDAKTFSLARLSIQYADAEPRFDLEEGIYVQVKSETPMVLGSIRAEDIKRIRRQNNETDVIEIVDTMTGLNTQAKRFAIAGFPITYADVIPNFVLRENGRIKVLSTGSPQPGSPFVASSLQDKTRTSFDSDEFRDEAADVFGIDKETGKQTGASVLENFKKDFSAAGNDGYEALLLDPNATPLGAFESAKRAITANVKQQTEELAQEGKPLSQRKCKEPKSQYTREIKDSTGRILKTICLQYQVETPSQVITSQLDQAMGAQFDKLIKSSDNPYAQIASAGLQQLVSGVMNAGFNKLTQLSVGAIRDAFSDEPTRTEVFASLTEETSPYEQANYSSLGGQQGGSGAASFDLDTFLNGRLEVFEDNPFGQRVVLLDDNSLVLQDNPLLEIGQSSPVNTNTISFFGQPYTYEEPGDFELIEISEDPTNVFDLDFYYVDSVEGILYKAERKDGPDNILSVRKIGSAIERLGDARVLMQSRQKTLSRFPLLAMEVDQQCVLGPDLGWSGRFDRILGRETGKAVRKAEKKEQWEEVLRGTGFAADWFKVNVREKMIDDLTAVRNTNLRDEVLSFNDLVGEIDYLLPQVSTNLAQVELLIEEYESEITVATRKQEILRRLSLLNEGSSIPKDEEIQRMIIENERIEKAYQSLSRRADQCFEDLIQPLAGPYGSTTQERIWPDDWYLEIKIAQDRAELLYCPFEMLSGTDGNQRLEQMTMIDEDINDEDLIGALRFRDQWVTNSLGPISNETKTFVGHGVRGVRMNADVTGDGVLDYPFIQPWIRGIDSAGVISHSPDDKEVVIHCSDFYRGSIIDYLPLGVF